MLCTHNLTHSLYKSFTVSFPSFYCTLVIKLDVRVFFTHRHSSCIVYTVTQSSLLAIAHKCAFVCLCIGLEILLGHTNLSCTSHLHLPIVRGNTYFCNTASD
uniref:Uncharacterized protein n=1 Tax=Trypanosoma vivax (strain Y486) TaxID=1055687 RepID=G0U7Q2_TRYVY|nr:hypothetical protein TVY486_1009550 [Trypanosoma vivax Y486]